MKTNHTNPRALERERVADFLTAARARRARQDFDVQMLNILADFASAHFEILSDWLEEKRPGLGVDAFDIMDWLTAHVEGKDHD
jgi:hypothetical protein